MSKYLFVVEMPITMSVEVEADSLKDAVEKAENSAVMGLCNQCASGEDHEWSTSGELDGDPSSCTLVDLIKDTERQNLFDPEIAGLWDGPVKP